MGDLVNLRRFRKGRDRAGRAEDAARDMGVLNVANAGPQIIAPFVASAIVTGLDGYTPLFLAGGALSLIGALAILPIRGVR